ncbi:hypothetical protein MELA_00674 [Candidatus Methylomirabilis lanthanidiphila]|uniref:Uncharacterized protein n=1 Tax=Candidatus Methylomirabilis lanthanidiphila TaxID=2211376 RepID=A0A564ZGL3_9BACT|nr:hypothetical protein [Candidatus Methylomirabilis lanthanidiphila]VUZ84303.1 hypothetical protein MELA_00674 [Candidatus Methylomirabilis lanthanidiphila]
MEMEWEEIRGLVEAMRKDLFTLKAPTQPLTALETVRTQFREAVSVFKSNPTKEGALEIMQLKEQLITLAKQTPGFNLASHAFAELSSEIEAGLKTMKDSSMLSYPIIAAWGFSPGEIPPRPPFGKGGISTKEIECCLWREQVMGTTRRYANSLFY